jgi:membrane protease YdiL (CAAX protease family)
MTQPRYPWKIFWLLLVGAILGVAAIVPYAIAIFGKVIAARPLPMPVPALVAVQFMENVLLFGGIIALGLLLARKVGIELPVLQRWFYGKEDAPARGSVTVPVVFGIAVASLSLLVFYTIFFSRIPEWPVAAEAMLPLWKRFLACFYGAINEELLARLFFLSLFLWLGKKIARSKTPRPGAAVFWIANIIVSILFAVGHVPAAQLVMKVTPLVIVALLTINGGASLVFGYLCWKRGLEAAIFAHFSADFVLHVVGPMFFRG